MTKGETDHIEGAAELDNQHRKTGHKCLCLLWVVLATVITGLSATLLQNQTEAELRQIIATQQEIILKQTIAIASK
tara:strand:+ start:5121 stop:5348 length:228 start_codon:yes stop_codon:yes gene_type:complete